MSAFIVFRDFLFYVCLFLVTSRGIYEKYYFNQSWEFADRSKLYKSSDKYKELEYIKLYFANKASKNFKNKVICINAGHGSPRGREYKVYCHPDASFKLISGSTKSGSQTAVSVSSGTTLSDGTPESTANLELSLCVKDYLLLNGYNVLMIREDNNCCFDNIARTVFANNLADAHIAIHYDGSNTDKGAFYLSIPDFHSYKSMYPVKNYWKQHELLGKSIIDGMKVSGVKIWKDGHMDMDLVQTSYSIISSIDLEVGDKNTNRSNGFKLRISKGIEIGLNNFFNVSQNTEMLKANRINKFTIRNQENGIVNRV